MKIKLISSVLSLVILGSLTAPGSVSAKALATITPTHQIVWSVLGDSTFEVKKVAYASTGQISLKADGGKVYMNNSDVSGWNGNLVEIDERPQVKHLTVSSQGDTFIIEQEGVKATTSLPLSIDPAKDKFSITTGNGNIFVLVAPFEAVESAKRSRFLTDYKTVKIEEKDGDLVYKIEGDKSLNVFNIFDYKIPVTVDVSPSTGNIVSIEGSQVFKIFGFLFS